MISYDQIFSLYRNEKNTNAISNLPENFEEEIKEYIKQLSEKEDLASKKELENVKHILKALIKIRLEKIALRAINFQKVDTPLLKNEEKFFEIIKDLTKEQQTWIEDISKIKGQDHLQLIQIKILKDVEEYVDQFGNTKGPYKKDQIIQLDKQEAEWLIKNNFAIKV
jgi:DNA replication initiation complex subunit (GINS family)